MWPSTDPTGESAYLRPWRLNNETVEAAASGVLEKKEKGGGCHRGPKARPRCRGRAAWGRSGDGGRSEEKVRGKKSEDAFGSKGAAQAGCERKRVKPWSRKIVEMRSSLWRKTGKGK
ncbi:hypothetical protein OIU74_030243 [Salix koriyanagi]|uniref:Uncharacterized protein n=1 Tax=Salix koriyanagi TaxID=2511006 RepID=A0A9Q0NIL3_9ROSI|nr:hypothetical protein OIU74_030243 [Salix koriyanagi]